MHGKMQTTPTQDSRSCMIICMVKYAWCAQLFLFSCCRELVYRPRILVSRSESCMFPLSRSCVNSQSQATQQSPDAWVWLFTQERERGNMHDSGRLAGCRSVNQFSAARKQKQLRASCIFYHTNDHARPRILTRGSLHVTWILNFCATCLPESG